MAVFHSITTMNFNNCFSEFIDQKKKDSRQVPMASIQEGDGSNRAITSCIHYLKDRKLYMVVNETRREYFEFSLAALFSY